ncbi:MAG: hypothetical protein VKK04_18665 [Synechococcales bacterium]|nr:hypothetical protein [Synechococcales bacterium]
MATRQQSTASGQPGPTPITIEAESMALSGYQVANRRQASNKQLITLHQSGQKEGTATTRFTGATGTYDVVVTYFDENDGQGSLALRVGDRTFNWQLDQNLGAAGVTNKNRVERTVATQLTIRQDELLEIKGKADQGEWTRVDSLKFIPVADSPPPQGPVNPPSPPLPTPGPKPPAPTPVPPPPTAMPGVAIAPTGNSTEVQEGGNGDTYSLVLKSRPTATVRIDLDTDSQLTTAPRSLTFTTQNWNRPQAVTIRAVDDALVEGNHTSTVRHRISSSDTAYNGMPVDNLQVNIRDNDRPASGGNSGNSRQLGTNVNPLVDWSTEQPFIDVFKFSRPWSPQVNGQRDPSKANLLNVDENGWLKSMRAKDGSTTFSTVHASVLGNDYHKGGRYTVLYDGQGTLQYGGGAKLVGSASRAGRHVIDVKAGQNILLEIAATDPKGTGDYIRNIRVVREDLEDDLQRGEVFNPEFLEKMDPYSVVRFMNWMDTNNSKQGQWSDRPTPEDSTYFKGAPVEVMVELANEMGADPWFNMPHLATPDYIENFARTVQENLAPDRKVYIEFSNEVWNGQFGQAQYARTQKMGESDPVNNGHKWYAQQAVKTANIWDDVFGSQSDRVISVVASQSANPSVADRIMRYANTFESNNTLDALAIAPYFGFSIRDEYATEVESWTRNADGGLGKLFDEITNGGVLSNSPNRGMDWIAKTMQENKAIADRYGVDLVAYEGGQHLVGSQGNEDNAAITKLMIDANRNPRMGEIYEEYLSEWNRIGGGVFVHFTGIGAPGKYGSWGALEHVGQDSSPKYDALMSYIGANGNG